MDAKEIEKHILRAKKAIEREVNDRLPRKVGIIAKNHFTQNFREGGFVDNGVRRWQRTRRQDDPTNPDSKYSPLTSRQNHLMRSIEARPGHGEVAVVNEVPYAKLHNEGGTITTTPTITPQMRRFAWAKVYALAGRGRLKNLPEKAKMWKAIALTKKTKLHITAKIPKRRFIGESRELKGKINDAIKGVLDNIRNLADI